VTVGNTTGPGAAMRRIAFCGETDLGKLKFSLCAPLLLCALQSGSALAAEPRLAETEITLLRELPYREGASKQWTLDLAMPKERGRTPRAAIVVIHGGGWLEGDKSSFSTVANRTPGNVIDFARLGFVAITINYRLSGEAPFPAALADCRCAVRWLRANAETYRVDPARIGAYGNSAGGHLALLLAMMPPTIGGDGAPYAEQSSRVQAAASDSGPLDLVAGHEQNRLRGVIEKFMSGPPALVRLPEYRQASPASYVHEKTPPLLLIYGEADGQVNVSDADQFVTALARAGNKDVSYFRLAGVDHCPHSLVRIPYLQQVVEEFFVRALQRPEDSKP
jgi:acetyl esterase/lipase